MPSRVGNSPSSRPLTEAAGARAVYAVDSAGGMTPVETAGYVGAAKDACDTNVGFYGHDNLRLAIANSIAAGEAGASFVDGTLHDIGRSAGNAPTEVLAAAFERLGMKTPLVPTALFAAADAYLGGLVGDRRTSHDAIAGILGYARVHSSFADRLMRRRASMSSIPSN